MDLLLHGFAACRDGLMQIAGTPFGLPASLFVAGLAGSVVHCAGMCGPFVLGQVMGDAEATVSGGYSEWRRLRGAALLPYQFGRFTTYSLLGAVAGGTTALFAASAPFAWLSGVLLLAAAALMAAQALGYATARFSFPAPLARLAAPLSRSRHPAARYALGMVLGLLPCGLLYAALAGAAGTASPLRGGLAMAAFALGTMPALIAVGWVGALAGRRFREATRWIAAPLLLANAALMTALAVQRL